MTTFYRLCGFALLTLGLPVWGQKAPYDVFPEAEAPYYRVRYAASQQSGELIFPVNYTVWIPPGVETLRGVIVHQHGCGEGSCKSGLTGAYDLHWQALARKHDCALLAPSYEQPDGADCQMWCDPRNGSAAAFRRALVELGKQSGHPELSKVPWALWGHSGGGHWVGGMTLLHPERVAAVWLRSGVPLLEVNPQRATIKTHKINDAALRVPMMCNPGTKEGVTVKEGRFAGVWPANESFFRSLRERGGLIGVAVDPITAHECGNQRYLAIPWLDACLTARLGEGGKLLDMPEQDVWLAALLSTEALPAADYTGAVNEAIWLPNRQLAEQWMHYVRDTQIPDTTPPPAAHDVSVVDGLVTWKAEADPESGLAPFLILRDGVELARVPADAKNPFGRVLFQGLQYSDTPAMPLVKMEYQDAAVLAAEAGRYQVISVNTVGLQSDLSGQPVPAPQRQ